MQIKVKSSNLNVSEIQKYLQNFIYERNWESYRSPKNLTMALAVEVAELMEIFQWMDESSSKKVCQNEILYQNIKDEMADVLSYLLQLAQVLEIDINEAFWQKTKKNEHKHRVINP